MATHYVKLIYDYIDDDYVLGMIVAFRNYTTALRFLRALQASKAECISSVKPSGPGPDYEQVLVYVDGAEALQPQPGWITEPDDIPFVISTLTTFVAGLQGLTTIAIAHRIQSTTRRGYVLFQEVPVSSDNEFTLQLVSFDCDAKFSTGWHLTDYTEPLPATLYDHRHALAPRATVSLIRQLILEESVTSFDVLMSQIDAYVIHMDIADVLRRSNKALQLHVITRGKVDTPGDWLRKQKELFFENPVRYTFLEENARTYSATTLKSMQEDMQDLELTKPSLAHPLHRSPSTHRSLKDFYQRYVFQKYIDNPLDKAAVAET